jgi:hypothetical protein
VKQGLADAAFVHEERRKVIIAGYAWRWRRRSTPCADGGPAEGEASR